MTLLGSTTQKRYSQGERFRFQGWGEEDVVFAPKFTGTPAKEDGKRPTLMMFSLLVAVQGRVDSVHIPKPYTLNPQTLNPKSLNSYFHALSPLRAGWSRIAVVLEMTFMFAEYSPRAISNIMVLEPLHKLWGTSNRLPKPKP